MRSGPPGRPAGVPDNHVLLLITLIIEATGEREQLNAERHSLEVPSWEHVFGCNISLAESSSRSFAAAF